MSDKILRRILREIGDEGLVDKLSEGLTPSDLQSLLLAVYKQRAGHLAPCDLVNQYRRNRFVQPAQASPTAMLEFDRLAYSLLPPDFEPLELSPLAPLGACSALGAVSQNNVVSTIRNTEVCSDSTNVLALECARRRQRSDARALGQVKLCASHRLLRTQRFEGPASFPHFRVFTLCTAGRDQGFFRFETGALAEQIDFYVRLLDQASTLGYKVEDARVSVTVLDERWIETLQTGVLDALAARYPNVKMGFDQERQSGRGYYVGACFCIHARDRSGADYMLVDGGFTTWTQQLLSNRKERLLSSGIGSERLCVCFGEGEAEVIDE